MDTLPFLLKDLLTHPCLLFFQMDNTEDELVQVGEVLVPSTYIIGFWQLQKDGKSLFAWRKGMVTVDSVPYQDCFGPNLMNFSLSGMLQSR